MPLFEVAVTPIFWRSDDYKTFEEADRDGACYEGEWIEGRSALTDVMLNVGRACDCVAYGTGDTIRARITIKGHRYDVNRRGHEVPAP